MAIQFYELAPSPYCRSVKTVARILGVPLTSHVVNVFEKDHLKPEYLAINPFHTIPAIDDNGFLLAESRVIIAYLVNKYAPDHKIYPQDAQKRALIDQMLYFDSGTISNSIIANVRPVIFCGDNPTPENVQKLKDHLKMLDDILAKNKYVAGDDLTVADICLRSMLAMTEVVDYDLSEFKHVAAWADKLRKELPDYEEINDIPLTTLREKAAAHKKVCK